MATIPERVRDLLGEEIPVGGHDSDTMFTDDKIEDIVLRNGGEVEASVAEGWRIKAAKYADLVDTSEGTSKRAFSDLHEHALRMAASYSPAAGSTAARSGTRPIVRRE